MKKMRQPNTALRLGIACAVSLLMFSITAFGQVSNLSQYSFNIGTCSEYDMSTGSTIALGANTDDGLTGVLNIGFTFTLGLNSYTQFKVNSNGYLTLGTAATSSGCCGYTLTGIPTTDRPAISIFSEDLHCGSDGFVSYKLFGSAPNRILVVHWRIREYPGSGQLSHTSMQIRLYEGSNKIEMWYGTSSLGTGNPGGIGVIIDASNYASINNGVISYSSATTSTYPNAGTCYSFTPCQSNVNFTGNVAQGGTANMNEGDTLLRGFQVMRGSQASRNPFTVYNGTSTLNACATRTYSYQITGAYASEYSISPTNGSLTNGSSSIPSITFRPGGTGLRPATLRVTDNAGLSRTFTLLGSGTTRIGWSGNIAQGGTPTVMTGDTLLNGTKVPFGTIGTFRPLTISNISTDPLASPPASVTYVLNDPTGHYSISPTSTSLNSGQNHSVDISFHGIGDVGYQEATLTVTADGESRTYLLRAFNAAPGGELFEGQRRITGSSPLFVNRSACLGVEIVSIEVTAYNTGAGNFVVYNSLMYETDTILGQGTPPYPLKRIGGVPVQSIDYFLSTSPGIVPKAGNQSFDSIIIPERESRTFYVNMIPTRPGKRFGQIYFRTNGFNMNDADVNGVPTRGMLKTGLFGIGMGSRLSGPNTDKRPEPVVMPRTEVRDEQTMTAWLHNSGECDMRISRSRLRFESGDVDEFELVSVLPNVPVVGDDFVLAPGVSDSVVIKFTPETYGSRRATLRLVTNDSTLGDGEVIERGDYYWDVFGVGSVGIEVRHLNLPPAVIDGPGSHGFVLLENTSGTAIEILNFGLTGGTGEIVPHSTKPWPTFPITMRPGEKLQVWVEMNATGAPGVREAALDIQLQGGSTATARITGYAGTRLLSALPGTLFGNMQVSVGEVVRQYVALTNYGTLPVHLNDPTLTETNPGDYRVGPLPRRILEPGQTELLEVTYTPQAMGPSSGTISFTSNGTNGTQVVNLGGEGTTGTAIGTPGGSSITVRGTGELNPTGKQNVSGGLQVIGLTPNPARDQVAVVYGVVDAGVVAVELYDLSGKRVWSQSEGMRTAGEHRLELNVSGLSSGMYYCLVKQGDRTVTQTVNVVR